VERISILLKKPLGQLSPAPREQPPTTARINSVIKPTGTPPSATAPLSSPPPQSQTHHQPGTSNNTGAGLPDPRRILNAIKAVVYEWNLPQDRLIWGANALEIFGIKDLTPLLSGAHYTELTAPISKISRAKLIQDSDAKDTGSGVQYSLQYALQLDHLESATNALLWIEDNGRWFAGPDGRPARAHGLVRIIPEQSVNKSLSPERIKAKLIERVDRNAQDYEHCEALIVDRGQFHAHLDFMFEEAKEKQSSFGLLIISIDNLPLINHSFGYDVGDEVVKEACLRIKAQMRGTDQICHYAGNRITLALEACDQDQIKIAAARFINATSVDPIDTSAGALQASIRLGGIIAPRHARSPHIMIQRAEESLQQARKQATKRMVIYEPSLARDDSRIRTQMMADQIIAALNDRRIGIALQPIVRSSDGKTGFYEALLRMYAEDGSTIPPSDIIPIAEKVGLIHLLDQRVLELALDLMVERPDLQLSVNISGATAHDPEWPGRAQAALNLHPGTAERLIMEITETCVIENIAATMRVIETIKQFGVRVAMDDFGAGHTSFRNLRDLAVDLVKIDGAFVQNLARSTDDRFFVRTLVDLAHHLNIPIVAEWVENQATATMLAEWGVDYFQGDFFGQAIDNLKSGPKPQDRVA
jgi:diguanylate cyclase (GGDEF)-like protein